MRCVKGLLWITNPYLGIEVTIADYTPRLSSGELTERNSGHPFPAILAISK